MRKLRSKSKMAYICESVFQNSFPLSAGVRLLLEDYVAGFMFGLKNLIELEGTADVILIE